MSHILMVGENTNLELMYRSVLEASGFKVMSFPSYKELYKNLNGEGFTAILIDEQHTERTLDFISKIRKNTRSQIPIYVVLDQESDQDPYLMFGNVTCITGFPNAGKSLSNLTKTLSKRSQFKALLHLDQPS